MKELVILSGKGGTGKTVIAASLIKIQPSVVAADCDLDAPNLDLLFNSRELSRAPLIMQRAFIRTDSCDGCGICASHCRFQAIAMVKKGKNRYAKIDLDRCEGCGLCSHLCPQTAIELRGQDIGERFLSKIDNGWLSHGNLEPPAENVGKFAMEIKNAARDKAIEESIPLLIVDGPPGIACTAIATLSGADLCLLVTEPTASGAHDMERVAALAKRMSVPTALVINRFDLNPKKADEIERRAKDLQIEVVSKVPFCEMVYDSLANGKPVVDLFPDSVFSRCMRKIDGYIHNVLLM
ncbi:MAG: ATP-binding protein [Methanomassiliicoccales archaeon]